jgi:hypothetical protein
MKKIRDQVLCVRIPSDEKLELQKIASVEDRSMTDMVLFFMRQGMATYAANKAPAAPAPVAKPKAKPKAKAVAKKK